MSKNALHYWELIEISSSHSFSDNIELLTLLI